MSLISHHQDDQRFVIELANDEDAVLEYRFIDATHIDFTRTYIPPSMRGKGIARELVNHGLNWAREQQLHIHASCWYVKRILNEAAPESP